MSSGPPVPIIPKVTSEEEYQLNKERLEKARKLLQVYDSMNEDAFRKHREEELAQKIAEGEKAREELERLKSRNAPLAITAPPTTSVPQNTFSPNPVYTPTMARIEEIPSHSEFVDQRVPMRSSYPSTSSSQFQVQQWSVQNQAPHPHAFFNNSGTIQEQADQAAASNLRYHRPKAIPSQATPMNRTPYETAVYSQAPQPAPLQQVVIPAASVDIHRPPAPQARKIPMPPQPSRSNAPQTATMIQQRTVPHRSHIVAPTATGGSVRSTEHGRKNSANSSTSLVVARQVPSIETGAAKATTGQPKGTAVPTIQSSSSLSRDDNHAQIYKQVLNNQILLDYLRGWYPHWLTSIRPDSYIRIPNTPLLIAKRPDNAMFLVADDGQSGYVFMDLASLASQQPVATQPAAPQGNVQQQTMQPAVPRSTASEAGSTQVSVQASAVPHLQQSHSTPLQVSSAQTSVRASESQPTTSKRALAIPQSQPTSERASAIPHSQQSTIHLAASDTGSAQTFVRASAPHSRLPTSEHQKQEQSSQEKPKMRTPADADKRHLARDILRALGIKRRRPLDAALGTEPAAKRHQPDPDVRILPGSRAQPTQLVFRVGGPQPDQPIALAPPAVNEVQSTGEPATSVGTLPVDNGLAQHVSNVVASTSVLESVQSNQPVMTVAPPDEPKAVDTPTTYTRPPASPPIKSSFAPVTVPSTLIDDPSPIVKSPKLGPGPVIENVAADSAEHPTPEEPTVMEVHGSATPLSTTHSVPYMVESPVAKTLDLRKKSEDATSDFDRLTIQDELISPAVANHREPSLQIEELEDGHVDVQEASYKEEEIVALQDVREVSGEGKIVMMQDVREASQEEGEISMQVDELEASQEEGELSIRQDELEASQEEGEISVQQDELEAFQEEGEISMQQDGLEASQEEGEISMQQDVLEASQVKGTILMSPRIKSGFGDAGGVPSVLPATPMPQAKEENKQVSRTPLFLPSPSASPQRVESPIFLRTNQPPIADYAGEDVSLADGIPKMIKEKSKSIYRRAKRKDQPFYILVPPPPPYLIKLRKEEARRRRKRQKTRYSRSASGEDVPDAATTKALEDSTTRLVERRCKWNACDTVMNSPQHLFEHLRHHCVPDLTKKYALCYWTACGDHIPNEQIDEHLATHAFTPLLCPYEDCEESFRAVQSLMKHNDLNHKSSRLKRTPEPFAPSVKEPPPVPSKVPAYVIKSGLVRQEPIDDHRHLNILGPWVYNNIAGPVRVTKKYNAARGKPDDYEFPRDSHFSTNPSQPARIRDMSDLQSVEVSGLVSDGLVIWPPPPKKKSVTAKNAETGLKLFIPNVSSEEDELQDDDLFGNNDLVMDQAKVEQARNYEVKHVSNLSTHQPSIEEDAVLSMLTEQ